MNKSPREKSKVQVTTASEGSYRGEGVCWRVTLEAHEGERAVQHGPVSLVVGVVKAIGYLSGVLTLAAFAGLANWFGCDIHMSRLGHTNGSSIGATFFVGAGVLVAYGGYRLFRPIMKRAEAWRDQRVGHDATTLQITPTELDFGDGKTLARDELQSIRVVASHSMRSFDVVATDTKEMEHMLFKSVPIEDIDTLAEALRKGGLLVVEQ